MKIPNSFILVVVTSMGLECLANTEIIDGIEWSYSVSDGTAKVSGANPASGSLVIPASFDGYPVTSIGRQAFSGCSGLTSITIPGGVTSIEYSAFYNCSGLTSITIPDGVTSIGDYAFYGCYGLSSFTIPDGVTSIGRLVFYCCTRLTSITIPDGVTSIGIGAFKGCCVLTSVTIPDSVTSIRGEAFYGCSGLTEVHISDLKAWCSISFAGFDSNPCHFAHRLFLNDEEITNLVIPDSVTSIGSSAFYGCSGLTSITIPDSVTSIGSDAFHGCSGLTEVHISDLKAWCSISFAGFDSNPCNYAHRLFLNDEEITNLVIPDSVTSIGSSAFYGCSGLTSITIPESVTSIGANAFSGCSGLRSVLLPRRFENDVVSFSIPSGCVIRFYDCIATLSVFSEYGHPTRFGTETIYSDGSSIRCDVEQIAQDPFNSDVQHLCVGWIGTGSVPATGAGTNCTFVLTEDSTLEWLWNTNVTVWISFAVDGDGTSAFRHGWFDQPEPAVVPFDAPAGLLRCTLSGDADGVTVDATARTVSIPTDRPRAVSLHVESLCEAVGRDGKFVDYAFGGDAPWIPLADESISDGRCLRSGVVGSGETSVLETTVSGAGRISFRWKTSCNRGDYCKFIVDGSEVASISRTATEWATVDHELGEGNHVIRWSWEKSASAVLGENGAFLDDVRWRPCVDLTVVSADGTPSPAVGATRYLYGDVVEASVAEPAAGAKTRHVCTGWTGTGSVPASGTDLTTTFAITNDSTLVWNWRTEHWIDIRARGAAKTDFTACWLPEGSIATVEFTPTAPVAATAVLGDSAGTTLDGLTLTVPVDCPRTVTVRVTAPNLALDVASAHGGAVPAPGRSWYEWGTEIDASVAEPTPSNGVQYVCTGWTGTGSVPASGAGTNAAFTVGEASSLTWNWQTNVWLSLSCTGRVIASLSGEWVERGTTKRVEYVPLTEFHDLKLTGDADGVVWDRAARTLDVPADRPRDLALSLTMLTLRTALDAEGFAWTTSGAVDWIPQVETSADGVDAARAGGIATGEESYLATTVSGPGTLSWSWMLDADGVLGVDVELDGNYALSLETSGVWLDDTLDVAGEGDHDIRFVFWNEDPDATNRTERAFLDRVSWTGAPPSPPVTKTSPVPVPHDWLANHASAFLAETGGDYETAAGAIAANGRTVWECFVAGLEPEDPASDFRVVIAVSNGVPDIAFDPFLESGRVYEVEGKETLDGEWGLTNATSRFFRGKVSLLDGWAPDGVDGFPEVVTVTFDANGGTVAPSSLSFDRTGNGLLGEVPMPVGTDVLFGGWFTELDGGVRFDQWSPLPWIDLSLFAHWNVSLAFDPNGGEGTMPEIVAPRGQSVTLPESGFAKVGHSFGGWAATAASEASWQPGQSVAFETSRTLFADWDVDRHSIAFDSAGGSAVPPLELDYGAAVVAPAPPVWDGYAFTGWTPPLPETMPASNLVATATWRLNPATLSFDTAGGTAIAPIVQNVGTPVVRPADPTRTGYTFAGWSPAFPATMPGSDTTLVAQWTPNRYLIRFRQNGGTGGMLDLECVYDKPEAIPSCTYVNGDIPFLGWAASPDGPVEYADGGTVLNLTTSDGDLVSLYAHWSPGSYRVRFDPNGGSGEMTDMVLWVDLPTYLAVNVFSKTNRFFAGWSTNGTDVVHFADGAEVVNLVGIGETSVLRAIWSETAPGLALRYYDNGYYNYSTWTGSESVLIGDFASRSFTSEATTLDWGETLDAGMTSANSDMESRYLNGGLSTEGLQLNSATNRFHGKYANDSQNYFSLMGEGFLWIDEPGLYALGATSDDGFVLYVDGIRVVQSNCSVGNGNLNLSSGWHRISFGYAEQTGGQGLSVQWKKPGDASFASIPQSVLFHRTGTDVLSFHPNGGTGEMADISVDRNFGTKLPQLAFEKTGHSFDGWATNETGTAVFSDASGIPPGVSDLYATWQVNRYSIQFDSNGGSSVSTITQDYGTPVTAPADPTRTGYTFAGWSSAIPATMPADDMTCTAQWTLNQYTIRFHANGGTGEMQDLECFYDGGVALPTCTFSGPNGAAFLGWSTTADGLVEYTDTERVSNLSSVDGEVVTLYAKWNRGSFTVHFDANGGTGEMADQVFSLDVPQNLVANVFSKTNLFFAGWATNETGNIVFANGATVHNLAAASATITLWAVWAQYMVVDLSGGSSATSYSVTYLAEPPSGGFNTDEYKTSKLVLRGLEPGPVPTRDATITKGFYVGLFEVTQKQWSLVMGSNPSSFSGDKRPVERVSYNAIRGSSLGSQWPTSNAVDADSFLGKLRARTGIDFDLPTEAQWEYACRAGTTTTYSYGDSADGNYMWYMDNSSSQTHEVGTKLPNPWGLYDMHGNVWEWCLDWYGGSLSGNDPVGSSSGSDRVRRGGSWYGSAGLCASSDRGSVYPSGSNYNRGFRLVRTLSNE